uniref:Uncharacterized protein n=1 Tax=Moschus moschiferus TaxID=68415 RepID=A0A8C6FGZ2_MOSMO
LFTCSFKKQQKSSNLVSAEFYYTFSPISTIFHYNFPIITLKILLNSCINYHLMATIIKTRSEFLIFKTILTLNNYVARLRRLSLLVFKR